MNVIITGAGGFLGGHLVLHFLRQGVRVIAVFHREFNESSQQLIKRQKQKDELQARLTKLMPYCLNLFFFDADITNSNDMKSLFRTATPNILIHSAALLIPPKETDYETHEQYLDALNKFTETNQAKILADCARAYQEIDHSLYCLFVSTVYVFDQKVEKITEESVRAPINMYAQTKDDAEKYWQSLGLNLAVIYPPQIYGTHQFTPAIIPRLIRKMLFDESPQLTLSGSINPINVNNLLKLIYALCTTLQLGRYCISGDGLLSLGSIAVSLQEAATDLLASHGRCPYTAPAYVVSETKTPNPPKVDDSRLLSLFATKYPRESMHETIPFAITAKEMIESHWTHKLMY